MIKLLPGAVGNTLWKTFLLSDTKDIICNDILEGKSKFSGMEDITCLVEGEDFIFSFKVVEKGLEDRSEFFKKEYICGDNYFYGLLSDKKVFTKVSCGEGNNKTDKDINNIIKENTEAKIKREKEIEEKK